MPEKKYLNEQARNIIADSRRQGNAKNFLLWLGALILGAVLGWVGPAPLISFFDFIAAVFTRLFQFIAVPTIALAVITTLSGLGAQTPMPWAIRC